MPNYHFQAPHLVSAADDHELLWEWSSSYREVSTIDRKQDRKTTNHIRFVRHLINASEDLPQRMITQKVILPARIIPSAKTIVQRAALDSMMHEPLFDEGSCLPSLRPGTQHGDQIDSPDFIAE